MKDIVPLIQNKSKFFSISKPNNTVKRVPQSISFFNARIRELTNQIIKSLLFIREIYCS